MEIIVHELLEVRDKAERELSVVQKITLRSFHPRAKLIEMVGAAWGVYYFWNHNWLAAGSIYLYVFVLAQLSVINISSEKMSDTMIGRFALMRLQPINLFVRTFGLVVFLIGVWQKSFEIILGGLSIFILGHTLGWSKVDSNLLTH